jgi:hypothetical protein
MINWKVFSRDPITDQQLADELALWLPKQCVGLRLFREGATICDFTWASDVLIQPNQLELLWLVRLFCEHFELYARRKSCDGGGCWQLRIVGSETDLPHGQAVKPMKKPGSIMLLGEHTTNGLFEDVPNRYRRARLSYPIAGDIKPGASCCLTVQHFVLDSSSSGTEPGSDAMLSCWTGMDTDRLQ